VEGLLRPGHRNCVIGPTRIPVRPSASRWPRTAPFAPAGTGYPRDADSPGTTSARARSFRLSVSAERALTVCSVEDDNPCPGVCYSYLQGQVEFLPRSACVHAAGGTRLSAEETPAESITPQAQPVAWDTVDAIRTVTSHLEPGSA